LRGGSEEAPKISVALEKKNRERKFRKFRSSGPGIRNSRTNTSKKLPLHDCEKKERFEKDRILIVLVKKSCREGEYQLASARKVYPIRKERNGESRGGGLYHDKSRERQ